MTARDVGLAACDARFRCPLSGVKRTSGGRGSPKSRNGTLWNVDSDHSGLMLANLITFAHFSTSAVMKV